MFVIHKKIKQVANKFNSLSKQEQGKVKEILKEYVIGEAKISGTYDKLEKEGFIKRIHKFRDDDFTEEKDEEELKKYIMNKIPNIAK